MNQEIHWGKIAALVVAIAGIASIAFVTGQKSAEVPVSEKQEVRLSGEGSSSATGGGDDQQKESSEKTVRYENKTYGFSMDIPVSWTKIEEEDARGSSTEVSFLTEEGNNNSTTRLTLAIIPPETFNETVRLCSLWIKYQYGADGASKNELADAQLCQSLGSKALLIISLQGIRVTIFRLADGLHQKIWTILLKQPLTVSRFWTIGFNGKNIEMKSMALSFSIRTASLFQMKPFPRL